MKKYSTLLAVLFFVTNMFAQSKLGGKVYFDYSYNSDRAVTNSFEIHRVYVSYSSKLTKNISYKFTSDVGRFNTGKDERMSLYLKIAALSWKTRYGKFVFGLQGLNMFNVEEHNWGYRFVEKAPMDKNHFASSADLGVGYYLKLAKKLNLSALITNGGGYKNVELNNFKKYSFQLLYGDSKISNGGFNVGTSLSFEGFDNGSINGTTTVFGGFAAYSTGKIRFGGEYDLKNSSGLDITSNIISAFADVKFSKVMEIFGRVDFFDPNTNSDNDENTYIIVGLNFVPGKGFSIAPNVKISSPKSGNSSTTFAANFEFKI